MDRAQYARLKAAFLEVILAPPEGRAAVLERACVGDASLRAEVERLLEADSAGVSFNFPLDPEPAHALPPLEGNHVGTILVEARVGEGGMGTVYRGFDQRLQRHVALKSIRTEWRLHPETQRRFLREAQILGRLKHPGICEIHGYEQTPAGDFLVLEFIDGRRLTTAVDEGKLTAAERDRIAAAIADVLRAAHGAGVVHRDLKPDNVMLTREGAVKVIDFGVARAGEALDEADSGDPPTPGDPLDGEPPPGSAWTRPGAIFGTPRYMSPEQARGEASTPASDIYSFGLILQQLFLRPDRQRRRLVERMLSHEVNARPSATEVVEALRRAFRAPVRRLQLGLGAAALVVLALAGLKYVTDLRAERARAEMARAQAERLVGLLLDELHSKLFLRENREVVARVSGEALRYFDELPEALQRASAARRARALRQHADVLIHQGTYPEARAEFARALQLDEQAVATPEAREGVAEDLRELAHSVAHQGEFASASALAERATEMMRTLVLERPNDTRLLADLASAWWEVGFTHFYAGELGASRVGFEHSVAIYRGLVRDDPQNGEWRSKLGEALRQVGDAQFFLGEIEGALRSYREGLHLLDGLVAEAPDILDYVGYDAETRLALARAIDRPGGETEVLALIDQARAAFAANQERDPTRLRWTRRLRDADLLAAQVLRRVNDEVAAKARLALAAFPLPADESSTLRDRAVWAEVELELGHVAQARPMVERLVALGWHRSPANARFAALARAAGVVP